MSDGAESSFSRDAQRRVAVDRAHAMPQAAAVVALISDVFYDTDSAARLRDRLNDAKSRGASIAVLPELPCNPWSPATKQARDDDAEELGGPRCTMQAEAAAEVGVALVGGAIIVDERGARRNTALVFDDNGNLMATFAKCHIPEESGFWETSHYEAGIEHAQVIHGLGIAFGVQICSDINRPEGSHILAAMGAEAIINPRATELATYERWKVVFRANALTSCAFVLSVNRPRPEQDVLIGGPSIAVGLDGRVLLETTDPVGVVTLDRNEVEIARKAYPGYLPVRAKLYASAWNEVVETAVRCA